MTASEAIAFVQSKRGIVCPNLGFRTQLESYATRFVGRSAKTDRLPARRVFGTVIAERIRQLKIGSGYEPTQGKAGKAP
jgi:atypical dual specificity phosphatase